LCDTTTTGLISFVIGSVSLNTWKHFALVRQNGTLYGFANGQLTGTASFNKTFYTVPEAPVIGRLQNDGYYFKGYIDELRVTK